MSRYLYNSVDVRCIENLVGKNIFRQLLTKFWQLRKPNRLNLNILCWYSYNVNNKNCCHRANYGNVDLAVWYHLSDTVHLLAKLLVDLSWLAPSLPSPSSSPSSAVTEMMLTQLCCVLPRNIFRSLSLLILCVSPIVKYSHFIITLPRHDGDIKKISVRHRLTHNKYLSVDVETVQMENKKLI